MIEKVLKRYPAGSDITLLNCFYQFRKKDPISGAYSDDFIVLLIKDNTTGKKDHFIINRPKYKFYTVKPEYEDNRYNKLFIEIDKLDEHEVEFNKLEKNIATLLGREADYNDALSIGDKESIRKLHADPRVFNSDQSIEDKYRHEFSKYYPNNVTKINKAFFDIEVDGRYITTDFPEPELAEAPINAISLFDERCNRVITFLLNDPHNPLIAKFKHDYEIGAFT